MNPAMTKPWLPVSVHGLSEVPVSTGVYEIRDSDGVTTDIGYAGSRETFGLRSLIQRELGDGQHERYEFRWESHVIYMSRYVELVLEYKSRHDGQVPDKVRQRPVQIHGRITPT
jgi:hypothetical protein